MVFEYATIEFDENEVLKKMDEAYHAMAHAQKQLREAQESIRKFQIKGNCGTENSTAKEN